MVLLVHFKWPDHKKTYWGEGGTMKKKTIIAGCSLLRWCLVPFFPLRNAFLLDSLWSRSINSFCLHALGSAMVTFFCTDLSPMLRKSYMVWSHELKEARCHRYFPLQLPDAHLQLFKLSRDLSISSPRVSSFPEMGSPCLIGLCIDIRIKLCQNCWPGIKRSKSLV